MKEMNTPHLPEHLGGGDELCGGGLVWSIMGDDGHGNRQIRAGSQTCNDQPISSTVKFGANTQMAAPMA